MTRLNSRQRKKWYNFLVVRDGEKCNHCGVTPKLHGKKLIVDRINNNDPRYIPENIQFLCYSCNYKKNPRKKERKPLDQCVCESVKMEEEKAELEPLNEIQINRLKEPPFRKYAEKRVATEREVSYDDLKHAGAEVVKASPATTEKYLRKMCSSAGPFEKFKSGNEFLVRKRKQKKP